MSQIGGGTKRFMCPPIIQKIFFLVAMIVKATCYIGCHERKRKGEEGRCTEEEQEANRGKRRQ